MKIYTCHKRECCNNGRGKAWAATNKDNFGEFDSDCEYNDGENAVDLIARLIETYNQQPTARNAFERRVAYNKLFAIDDIVGLPADARAILDPWINHQLGLDEDEEQAE